MVLTKNTAGFILTRSTNGSQVPTTPSKTPQNLRKRLKSKIGRIVEKDEKTKIWKVEDDLGEIHDVKESKAIMVHGQSLRKAQKIQNF